MAFMNYILRPEVSKLISADFPYTNPNLEARKLLSPEELSEPRQLPAGQPEARRPSATSATAPSRSTSWSPT